MLSSILNEEFECIKNIFSFLNSAPVKEFKFFFFVLIITQYMMQFQLILKFNVQVVKSTLYFFFFVGNSSTLFM